MEIRELEKIVRAAVRGDPMGPALAGLADSGQVQLPEEFHTAAKALMGRSQNSSGGKSILHTNTEAWA